jgi:hypothetical protein
MIGDKIVLWSVRFILIALFILLGNILLDTALQGRLQAQDAHFQLVFSDVLHDAIDQGVINDDIFADDYYTDMFNGNFGFKLVLMQKNGTVLKETYYQKAWYTTRYGIADGSKYASYDGFVPVWYKGKEEVLQYSIVFVV